MTDQNENVKNTGKKTEKTADNKPVKDAGQKAGRKPVKKKTAKPKSAEKTSEKKSAEKKSAEKKTADKKTADKKKTENSSEKTGGRRSGGGNRGGARRQGSSKPAKKQLELQKAELLRAGFEEVLEDEAFYAPDRGEEGLLTSPKLREFMKKRQAEINALAEPFIRQKKAKQAETIDAVESYRAAMEAADNQKSGIKLSKRKQPKAAKQKNDKPGFGHGKIKIIFLGGLDQIGMNIT